MDVLTGQLVEMNARYRARTGPATVDFLDPYLAFSMNYYLESHYRQKWNLVNVAGVDQVSLLDEGRVEYGPMSLHPGK